MTLVLVTLVLVTLVLVTLVLVLVLVLVFPLLPTRRPLPVELSHPRREIAHRRRVLLPLPVYLPAPRAPIKGVFRREDAVRYYLYR